MRSELILPPLSTVLVGRPYASVPLLAAYASQHGCDGIRQTDLNTPFFEWLLREEFAPHRLAEGGFPGLSPSESVREQALFRNFHDQLAASADPPPLLAGIARHPTLRQIAYNRLGLGADSSLDDLNCMAQPDTRCAAPLVSFYKAHYRHREIPPLVGISIPFSSQLVPALVLAATLREMARGPLFIVLGGPVPTLLSDAQLQQLLERFPVDAVVRHEGESAFAALHLADLSRRDALDGIPSLVRLRDGLVAANPLGRVRLSETADAPFDPAYIARAVELPVMVGRGCYYRCSFCDYIHLYQGTNYRTPEDVAGSARQAARQSTTGLLHFIYEVLPLTYLRRLSAALIEAGTGIRWRGFQRVYGELSAEDVRRLECSGCRRLDVGLESADEPSLERMCKGYGREEIRRFLGSFAGSSIQLLLNIIVDYPGLSAERALDAAEFLEDDTRDLDNVHFEVMRFSLTTGSEMSRAPEDFELRILSNPPPPARSPEFLSLNRLAFESISGMNSEQADLVEERYRRMNAAFERRRAEAWRRKLRCGAGTASWVRIRSGPFLSAPDPGAGGDLLLHDLATQQTLLVSADYRATLAAVLPLASQSLSAASLDHILQPALPALSASDRLEVLCELRLVESVEPMASLRTGIAWDRNFYRGATRPSADAGSLP